MDGDCIEDMTPDAPKRYSVFIEELATPPVDLSDAVGIVHVVLASAYDAILREKQALLSEVREWMCVACNYVYPGPPQEGFACVMCPRCKGFTVPRTTVERRNLEVENTALQQRVTELEAQLAGKSVTQYDADKERIARLRKEKERLVKVLEYGASMDSDLYHRDGQIETHEGRCQYFADRCRKALTGQEGAQGGHDG